MINETEVVLPNKTFAFVNAPFSIPPFPSTAGPSGIYSIQAYGYLNGFPAIAYQDNATGTKKYIYFFDSTSNFTQSTLVIDSIGAGSTIPFIFPDTIFFPVDTNKGLTWYTFRPAWSIFGQPQIVGMMLPYLPGGSHQSTLCFPEGNISCDTVMGKPFAGTWGSATRLTMYFDSGSGCPTINNYGPSVVPVYDGFPFVTGTPPFVSTSEGSGLGPSPLVGKYPDMAAMFNTGGNGQKGNQACDLGNGLIAVLTGPSDVGFGTLLRVYRWEPKITNANGIPEACMLNSLSIAIDLIYERDLLELIGAGTGSTNGCFAISSPFPGALITLVKAAPDLASAHVFMRFPGPVVQVIFGAAATDGTISRDFYTWVSIDGRIAYYNQYYNVIRISTGALDLNVTLTLPAKYSVWNVKADNIYDTININRSY